MKQLILILLGISLASCGYIKGDFIDLAYPDRCKFLGDFIVDQEFNYNGCEWFIPLKQPSERKDE